MLAVSANEVGADTTEGHPHVRMRPVALPTTSGLDVLDDQSAPTLAGDAYMGAEGFCAGSVAKLASAVIQD